MATFPALPLLFLAVTALPLALPLQSAVWAQAHGDGPAPNLPPLATFPHLLPAQPTCEPIQISLCVGLGYNETVMPNRVGHDAQTDADALLQTFTPLIQYGCAAQLKLFLCSAYVPMCTDKVPEAIGPCRDLCESVRGKCEPVLTEFGFTWPLSLSCEHFHPQNNHQHMCIPANTPNHQPAHPFLNPRATGGPFARFVNADVTDLKDDDVQPALLPHDVSVSTFGSAGGSCGRKVGSRGECWIRCEGQGLGRGDDGGLFVREEELLVRKLLVVTALVTLVGSTLAVLMAVTVARGRSSPFERPIVYMAFCQALYSLGVACGAWSGAHSCMEDKLTGLRVVAKGPLIPPACSLLFLVTFFFWMAGALWWVLLCLSWTLSVSGREVRALETRECSWWHVVAWPLASALTCVLLLLQSVEGDELTGLCGVGYQTAALLLYFEMLPLSAVVVVGVLLLVAGVSLSLRERRRVRRFEQNVYMSVCGAQAGQERVSAQKKEESVRAWKRVLCFALVQLVPLLCELGVAWYELGGVREEGGGGGALVLLLLVKHVMKLVGGLLCVVWVLWLYAGELSCRRGDHGGGDSGSGVLRFLSRSLSSGASVRSRGGRRLSGGLNSRSLPPVPLAVPVSIPVPQPVVGPADGAEGAMLCGLRTETWRRGETIV